MTDTATDTPSTGRGENASMELLGDKVSDAVVKDLISLVWGTSGPNRDNLHRWSQGFAFSSGEPTALIQLHGGPCAVIAPVQAYIIKNAIFCDTYHADQTWRTKNADFKDYCTLGAGVCFYRNSTAPSFSSIVANQLLATAFTEIFSLLSATSFVLVLPGDTVRIPSKRDAAAMEDVSLSVDDNPESPSESVHVNMRTQQFDSLEAVSQHLEMNPSVFCSSYGVLRFLYSVILSKTIEGTKKDLEDPTEALIDSVHGHGNQSLINLLITGSAVANVWDDEKEFGALRLQGIRFRPAVGFLSLLENMRYVEVGFYYKCPQFPIWILGSETHLSILFALIPSLVTSEAEEAAAVRAFRQYDEHGSGFISADNLGDILELLDLFREDDYVSSLKQKLDKEHLGIILRSDFLSEFFPSTGKFHNGQQFDVYHYNGLARSESPIRYHHGRAKILDLDLDLEIITIADDVVGGVDSDSAIVRCLRTKYPRVEIVWDDNKIPSIN